MSRARRNDALFALILALFTLAGAAFLTAHHEMWRDEAQAFMMARDAASLDDLALRVRFDGHPVLWYVILFVLTRFTASLAGMQVVHLLIAAGAVFVFARWAPFPRFVRILFAFSYYPLYEFGVISRGYGLGMLLLFIFCAVFPGRRKSLLLPAAVLLLMSVTHLHLIILAGPLAFVLAAEAWFRRREGRPRFLAFAAVVVTIGLAVGVYQARPCADSLFSKSVHLNFRSETGGAALRSLAKAYVVLPDPQLHFWGKSLISRSSLAPLVLPLLTGLLLVFALLVLLDRPLSLVFYAASTAGLLAFFWLVYLGFLRHHAYLFLAFVAALWMAAEPGARSIGPGFARRLASGARRFAPAVLGVLLAVQVVGAGLAAVCEVRYPFSQARRAAEFVRGQGLLDHVLVADTQVNMAAFSAYLGRPLYYPYLEDWGTYCKYVHGAHETMSMTPIVAAAERLSRETGREYLIVLSYPLDQDSLRTRGLRPAAAFGSPVMEDETFYLYRRERRPSRLNRAAFK